MSSSYRVEIHELLPHLQIESRKVLLGLPTLAILKPIWGILKNTANSYSSNISKYIFRSFVETIKNWSWNKITKLRLVLCEIASNIVKCRDSLDKMKIISNHGSANIFSTEHKMIEQHEIVVRRCYLLKRRRTRENWKRSNIALMKLTWHLDDNEMNSCLYILKAVIIY